MCVKVFTVQEMTQECVYILVFHYVLVIVSGIHTYCPKEIVNYPCAILVAALPRTCTEGLLYASSIQYFVGTDTILTRNRFGYLYSIHPSS